MGWFGGKSNAAEHAVHLVLEGVRFASAGHYDRGLAAFEEVLRECPAEVEPALRRPVADALYNKAVALSALGRGRDVENTLEELIRRFRNDSDPEILNTVTRGFFNLGASLQKSGQRERAAGQYRELVQRYDDRRQGDVAPVVCDALSNLCRLLLELERNEDALGVASDLLARLDLPFAKQLKADRIDALEMRSAAHAALGRHEEALGWLDEALRQLGDYNGPGRTERTVSMLTSRGTLLHRLGRLSEAASCYDDAFRASIGSQEPDATFYGARALRYKAGVEACLGAHDLELETLSAIVQRFAGRLDPRLTDVVGWALVQSRARLEQAGRHEEAHAVEMRLDAFGAEMRKADDDHLVARVLIDQSHRMERLEDRLQMIDAVVAGLEEHPRSGHDDTRIALALSRKALELVDGGRLGDAIEAWDRALDRLSGRQDDSAEEVIAPALLYRAYALNNLGCLDAALSTFAELGSRFEHRRNPRVNGAVRAAGEGTSHVHRCRRDNLAAGAPAVTLPEVVVLSSRPIPEGRPLGPVPHFVRAQLDAKTMTLRLEYAAHDPNNHAVGVTGLALLANLLHRVEAEKGRPNAIVAEFSMDMHGLARPDTNYQLAVENMAVFGLPLHVAMRHTHAGTCAAWLDFRLKTAVCTLGTAMVGDFQARATGES